MLGVSIKLDNQLNSTAVVAEWLRRWTRNPLGSARTGSNPVGSDDILLILIPAKQISQVV